MRFIFASLLFICFLSGCKEEDLSITPSSPSLEDFGSLDLQSAKNLEVALSKALADPAFVEALRLEFVQFKTGDSEVLVSEVLSPSKNPTSTKSGPTPRSIFIGHLSNSMTTNELDKFLADNPNYIFGLRGNLAKFFDQKANSAAAYVMPENFVDNTTSVSASLNGQATTLQLNSKLDIAVVVLQKSERHTANGTYLLDIYEGGFAPGTGTLTQPAVVQCPEGVNSQILSSFTAEETNGGILLSYEIAPSNTNDLIINIFRLDPGASNFSLISQRSESDDRLFYDTNLSEGINVEYRYRLEVLISTTGSDGLPIECDAETLNGATEMYAMATATTTFTRVASFSGRNISSSAINYTWSPPENTPVNEYRLSILEDTGLREVAIINTSQNQLHQFTYNYPSEDRGELIEMQIQYRAAGGTWVGDFYTRTYGSFRDGDEPFMYYGIRINDIQEYEPSGSVYDANFESQLRGSPEIRLISSQAISGVDEPTAQLTEQIIFTENCCHWSIGSRTDGYVYNWEEVTAILTECDNTSDRGSFFVPNREDYSREGIRVLDRWDSDLTSGAITINTTETDATDIRVLSAVETDMDINTITFSFGTVQPMFSPFTNVMTGVTSTFNNTTARTISYPGDFLINSFTTYYHEPMVKRAGNELFGYSTIMMGTTSGGTSELELNSCPALDREF